MRDTFLSLPLHCLCLGLGTLGKKLLSKDGSPPRFQEGTTRPSPAAENPYREGLCSFLDDKALNDVCEDLGLDDGLWRFGVSHLT